MKLCSLNSSKIAKVDCAVRDSEPLDIGKEVSEITAEFQTRAVGPAAGEILERGLAELDQLSDILKKIPGQPPVVQIKTGRNSVKLYWDPPEQNPEAVEEYVVYKKIGPREWEESGRTTKRKLLVKGLKSGTLYEFQVVATNKTLMSLAEGVYVPTAHSTARTVYRCVLMGAGASLCLPMTIGVAHREFVKSRDGYENTDTKVVSLIDVGITIAALPVSIILAPVTLPVLTVALAKDFKDEVAEPEEESDDD